MVSLFSKLRSLKIPRTQQPGPGLPVEHTVLKPQSPDWTARRTFSISPKLRTFFEPQTPTNTNMTAVGVLESPHSPESAYSGVVTQAFDVEIVRRVSKGKVKRIELTKVNTYESACIGTQTEDYGARAGKALKRKSGLAKREWEMLHSSDAGLLFMTSPTKQEQSNEHWQAEGYFIEDTALLMTGNLLLKLEKAIAADAELQSCQKRTTREISTLITYQENLRKRKEVLKDQLQQLKGMPDSELDEEKLAVDKELMRVWEASIDAMDERLRSEERLEKKRDAFELIAKAALAVLALGLKERGLVDRVDSSRERAASEVEFEQRYR